MAEQRRITIPYAPRRAFLPYHNRTQNRACLVAHRRAGKTVATVNDLVKRNLLCKLPRPMTAYIAPLMRQARQVAWDYVKQYTRPVQLGEPNETRLSVTMINGGTVQLFGGDNPDALRGMYLDEVVLDEFGDMRPGLWTQVVYPALADRSGGATFIGTPKGHNEFYDIWERARTEEDWFALMLKADETGLLPAEFLEEARKTMTVDEYDQEFDCSFEAAIRGAYYGKEMRLALNEGRIGSAPYEPALPVVTAWDLGIGDSTAIWFAQFVGQQIRLIDFYEAHGEALPHYVKLLQSKGYVYGDHWLPHDAQVRELGTGKTRVETMRSLGVEVRIAPNLDVEDGINAVRVTLGRCWFDDRCKLGIEALRQYRTDYDDKVKAFKDRPLHDWSSHAADAFRYLCVAYRQEAGLAKPPIGNAGYVVLPGLPKQWRSERV